MSREINKECEFSCDEAIIAKLDFINAQDYGKTLLDAMATTGKYKEMLASITLNKSKELLKERLGAIMNFKKKSIAIKIVTSVLTLVLCVSATVMGAYSVKYSQQFNHDIVIDQIDFYVIDNEKVGIKVTFLNKSEMEIDDIFVRIKFPNGGTNVDYSTKDNPVWKLADSSSYTWGLSYNDAAYFKIAITAYKTIDGKINKVSESDIKWIQFYYPGKDNIIKNNQVEQSKEVSTTKINESLYGNQYFLTNLSKGDICDIQLSWNGEGNVYLAYVGNKNFDSDIDGNILLSSFTEDDEDYFVYKILKNKEITLTVPTNGLYVFPVKDKSGGDITNVIGEVSYPAY